MSEPAGNTDINVSATTGSARQWVCTGVPYRRRLITGVGVALATALFFFLAAWQGASMLVSTIIGIVFLGGFVGYLVVVAPTPFTLALDATGIRRAEPRREPITVPWSSVARVKEERFKSGKSVSLAVYRRIGERGLHRAFVVYRDDIPAFDGFLAAMRTGVPEGRPWLVETVHE